MEWPLDESYFPFFEMDCISLGSLHSGDEIKGQFSPFGLTLAYIQLGVYLIECGIND